MPWASRRESCDLQTWGTINCSEKVTMATRTALTIYPNCLGESHLALAIRCVHAWAQSLGQEKSLKKKQMNQRSGHVSRQRSKVQPCFINAQTDVGQVFQEVVPGEGWNAQARLFRLKQPLPFIPVSPLSAITLCVPWHECGKWKVLEQQTTEV